jgi:predicted Zn finger-like uncharacterized protein
MVAQCPQCGTGHIVDQEELDHAGELAMECTKCRTSFLLRASGTGAEVAPRGAQGREKRETITVIRPAAKLPPGRNVALVVMQGGAAGRVFRFQKPEVVIGRIGADMVVEDPEVSATHCAVEVRGNYGVLTDLGSTNGTYVGEEPVKTHRLEHLSEFRIGATTLMFTITRDE